MSEHHPHPHEAPPAQSSGYAEQAEYGEAASHSHHEYSQQAPQQQASTAPPPLPPDPWLDGPSMTNLEVVPNQAPPATQPDSDDSSWLPASAPEPSWLPDAPYGTAAQAAPPQQAQPLPPGVPIAPNGAPVPFSVDADWTQAPVLPAPGDQQAYPVAQPAPAASGPSDQAPSDQAPSDGYPSDQDSSDSYRSDQAYPDQAYSDQSYAPSDGSAQDGTVDDQDWAALQRSSGITPLPEQPAEPDSGPDQATGQAPAESEPMPESGYRSPESFTEQQPYGEQQQPSGQQQAYGAQQQSYGEQPHAPQPDRDDQSYSAPEAFPSSRAFPQPPSSPESQAPYDQAPYDQAPYDQAPYDQAPYDQAPYSQPYQQNSAPQGYPHQQYQQGLPQQAPSQQYQQEPQPQAYQQGPPPQQHAPQQHAPQGHPHQEQSRQGQANPGQANPGQRRHGAEQQPTQQPQQFGPPAGFDGQAFGGQNAAAQGFSGPLAPSSAADLSTSTLIKSKADVPSSGWRRVVFKATAGALNPGLSKDELHRQSQIDRIRTPVRGCHRIAVVSLKGGIGKTTTTSGLGLTLAHYRGDRVVALDANPDAGTLAERLTGHIETSVRNLLDNYDSIQSFTDVSRYMSLAERLQVIASDQDPEVSEAFDAEQYKLVCDLLARFYNVVLTDSGTGMLHSAMAGTLQMADSLVVVGAPSVDGASRAAKTLDWLIAHGHDDLVRRSVAVISSVREKSGDVDMEVLRNHFGSRCRAVVEIPYDPHLVIGGLIDMQQIKPATTSAYLELAATVADGFVQS